MKICSLFIVFVLNLPIASSTKLKNATWRKTFLIVYDLDQIEAANGCMNSENPTKKANFCLVAFNSSVK